MKNIIVDNTTRYMQFHRLALFLLAIAVGIGCFKLFYDDFSYWQHIAANAAMLVFASAYVWLVYAFRPDLVQLFQEDGIVFLRTVRAPMYLTGSFQAPAPRQYQFPVKLLKDMEIRLRFGGAASTLIFHFDTPAGSPVTEAIRMSGSLLTTEELDRMKKALAG